MATIKHILELKELLLDGNLMRAIADCDYLAMKLCEINHISIDDLERSQNEEKIL